MVVSYYILQNLVLSLGLGSVANLAPKWMRLPRVARVLVAVATAPLVIGLVVMILARLGVTSPEIYSHAPVLIGIVLWLSAGPNRIYKKCKLWLFASCRERRWDRLALLALWGILLGQVAIVIASNVKTATVLNHDFNVYMASAKNFTIQPSWEKIPHYAGEDTGVIAVHPHSFIFEAFLAHAQMLQGPERETVSSDVIPKLGQQLTLLYMIAALVALAYSMGARWSLIAVVAILLSTPWIPYITSALGRDAFRVVPILAITGLLATLGNNFCANLWRRGSVIGFYMALTIMAHTLGAIILLLAGTALLAFVVIRRRPTIKRILCCGTPCLLFVVASIWRYLTNYFETGELLGYGLQYSVYRGTWIESLLATDWKSKGLSPLQALGSALSSHGYWLNIFTILSIALVLLSATRWRGRLTYFAVAVALYPPLLTIFLGVFNYVGINLRDAFLANFRYPLSFFFMAPALLSVGFECLGRLLSGWGRRVVVVLFSAAITVQAIQHLRADGWRTSPLEDRDVETLHFLKDALRCLKPQDQWMVDNDVWNVYFMEKQPIFTFTMPARAILVASGQADVGQVIAEKNIKIMHFIYSNPTVWGKSDLYRWFETHWRRKKFSGGPESKGERGEVWLAPEIADCVGTERLI